MEQLINVPCPLCREEKNHQVLAPRDWMLTQQVFPITACDACGFWFTNPRPAKQDIGLYYKHEDYISHTSRRSGWMDRVYHLVRAYSLRQKVRLLSRFSSGGLVVDYGCGTGHFVNQLLQGGYNAVGFEPDGDAREVTFNEFGFQTKPLDQFGDLPVDSVDVLTMWHVLEHVYDLRDDIQQIVQKLRVGGHWIVAVPNRLCADARHYGEFWAAYDVPRHLSHFVHGDIERIAADFNLSLIDVRPMKFDAYYVSLLSEKYKKGSVLFGAWNGFKSNVRANRHEYSSLIYVLRKK